MANSGSSLSASSNKWHSTATHTSSSITSTQCRRRPSIPLSEISTNINAATATAAAMTTISTKCIYVKEVISFNNNTTHLTLASSDGGGSGSDCESGELSSDEYPSQIKLKPIKLASSSQNIDSDSTHEMGTLAQLLNYSPAIVQIDASFTHQSDVHRHEVPDNRMRSSSSSSSTPRIEHSSPPPCQQHRLSQHLSTTIQRQKIRSEQRQNVYAQLKI